jgi:hypothetical protein
VECTAIKKLGKKSIYAVEWFANVLQQDNTPSELWLKARSTTVREQAEVTAFQCSFRLSWYEHINGFSCGRKL